MINLAKLFIVVATVFFLACTTTKGDNEINCTEEIVVIVVKVTGGSLDDYYTIRNSTNDTIRVGTEGYPISNWYPVLDDSFQPILKDKREDFYFVGVKNGQIVINQRYEIGADRCHIIRYFGPAEISLN